MPSRGAEAARRQAGVPELRGSGGAMKRTLPGPARELWREHGDDNYVVYPHPDVARRPAVEGPGPERYRRRYRR